MAETPQYDQSLTIALLRARDAVTALFREHVAAAGLTLQQWLARIWWLQTGAQPVQRIHKLAGVIGAKGRFYSGVFFL